MSTKTVSRVTASTSFVSAPAGRHRPRLLAGRGRRGRNLATANLLQEPSGTRHRRGDSGVDSSGLDRHDGGRLGDLAAGGGGAVGGLGEKFSPDLFTGTGILGADRGAARPPAWGRS